MQKGMVATIFARRVNSEGISVTLDHLGENVTSLEEAAASRDEYIHALDQIQAAGLDANVSIKLTQFGIDIDEAACHENVEMLVKVAVRHSSFVSRTGPIAIRSRSSPSTASSSSFESGNPLQSTGGIRRHETASRQLQSSGVAPSRRLI